MTKVWVDGKILNTANKKAKKWKPPADPEPEVYAICPDCGAEILSMTSCWRMEDRTVCIGCYEVYYEAGIGYMDCAGLTLPGISLEG